ncbi:sensor domain-containing protein [Kitasatospora purpeofusca]|uniref:sensor domain-containing protein n=1 Tax=Kitasatospora purpeofusca TaxID=67352 RepID=UPI00224FC112|nr:sensor domain-containing protein [Kitasatospora purpeofusca]MCX4686461.1 sensor domain-containing protein [Kitasatospora purpeofusca]
MSTHTTQRSEYDAYDGRTGYAKDDADGRRPGAVHRTEEPPYAWRAPFSSYFYREVGYTLTGLPVAILGFVTAVTLFALGVGTFVTVLGLPILAGLTTAARGFGRLERARVRGLLALDVPGPAPARPRPGFWGAVTARLADAAGWKAVLYQVVMFPWAILSMTLSLVFLSVGWTLALYPAYHWVFARWTDWPGYRLFDFTNGSGHHVYYIESPLQIAGVCLVGLLFVFVTPQLVRGLTNVSRLAARGLLGR